MAKVSVWGSLTTEFVGVTWRAEAIHASMLPTCRMRRAKLSYMPIRSHAHMVTRMEYLETKWGNFLLPLSHFR
jgi:hypothetical protein